jgi:hypothetical protein
MSLNNVGLCKYKDTLGELRKGPHKIRDPVFDTALTDVISTIIGAGVISWYMNYQFISVLLILFILGIILHRIFCVRTQIDKFLFPHAQ